MDVLGIGARPVQVAAWNREHGFTQPVVVQYWHYVDGLLHGDLGYSYKLNQSIASLFEERLARSLYLSGTSLALALLATIALGSYQAVRRRLGDRVATGLEYTLMPCRTTCCTCSQSRSWRSPGRSFPYQASRATSLLAVMADWRSMVLPITCPGQDPDP